MRSGIAVRLFATSVPLIGGINAHAAAAPAGASEGAAISVTTLIALITSVAGISIAAYQGMKYVFSVYCETDNFREKLMKIVYRDFDSSDGQKKVGKAALKHFQDEGKDELLTAVLGVISSNKAEPEMARLIVRLADFREDSKELVEQATRDIRRRVQSRTTQEYRQTADEVQQVETDLQQSRISQLAEDPLINAPEIREMMVRVLRSLAGEHPKEEQQP